MFHLRPRFAVLVASVVVLSGCTTTPSGSNTDEAAPLARAADTSVLAPAQSCDALLVDYHERGAELVTPWGWQPRFPPGVFNDGMAAETDVGSRLRAAPEVQTNSTTGTNVQEQGVDEPDSVKTLGNLLAHVQGGSVALFDVSGSSVTEIARVDTEDIEQPELLLTESTLTVLGPVTDDTATKVISVDIADPAQPDVVSVQQYDSRLVTARQHGDVIRLITRTELPDLGFVTPEQKGVTEQEALKRNRELVRETSVADWLPQVQVNDADPEAAVECDQVEVPQDTTAANTLTIHAFGADDPDARDATGVLTTSDIVYAASDRLYVAHAHQPSFGIPEPWGTPTRPRFGQDTDPYRDGRSDIYAFALRGVETAFAASGSVRGTIADRWSMDSADQVLRLALGPSSATGNFNAVVMLREKGERLKELSRVNKLGVGEDIKSVRWFDNLAIVVTFRQVDPLYTIDLTKLARPKLVGKLKIPGFSSYLHPLGPEQLIGMGTDARGSAQAGLFSVVDLANPRRLDLHTYARGTRARAGDDPRQFLWLPDRRLALTVIQKTRSVRVSVLKAEQNKLTQLKSVQAGYGVDASVTRTIPVTGDRVVVVNSDSARFLDLPR